MRGYWRTGSSFATSRQPNPHAGGRETNNTAFVRSNGPRRPSPYLFFCPRIPSPRLTLETKERRR